MTGKQGLGSASYKNLLDTGVILPLCLRECKGPSIDPKWLMLRVRRDVIGSAQRADKRRRMIGWVFWGTDLRSGVSPAARNGSAGLAVP